VFQVDFSSVLSLMFRLALLGGVALYTGRVLMSYLSKGTPARPVFDKHNPWVAAEQRAEWLGVKAVGWGAGGVAQVFAMLSEASAEVGEWVLARRRHHAR
jgi:hypothetical protein